MLSLLCFYQHWNSTLQIPYTKVFNILLPPHQLEKIRDVPSHSSNSSRFKLPVANLPPSTSPVSIPASLTSRIRHFIWWLFNHGGVATSGPSSTMIFRNGLYQLQPNPHCF
ncbi:hypothetical protein YC2023_117886 [Brassica napus]